MTSRSATQNAHNNLSEFTELLHLKMADYESLCWGAHVRPRQRHGASASPRADEPTPITNQTTPIILDNRPEWVLWYTKLSIHCVIDH